MSHARALGAMQRARVVAYVATLVFALGGMPPALADDDDDDYERGPKIKVDDNGKEYKYEYEDRRCKYKYELKYRTGEEKVEREGDCRGVGPHRAVYYSDGPHRRLSATRMGTTGVIEMIATTTKRRMAPRAGSRVIERSLAKCSGVSQAACLVRKSATAPGGELRQSPARSWA